MAPTIEVSREQAVGWVTLARPEARNAFNEQMIAELTLAFTELGADPSVRAIVLASTGRAFSAGADLEMMRRQGEAGEAANLEQARTLAAMLRAVADCPHPVLARVQGAALGGGAGLVAACDIALAAESAVLGFPEVRLGLVPATVSPHVIEKVGPGAALRLFLSGERIDAQTALRLGLVARVVPDDHLDGAVDEVIGAILAGAAGAHAVIKRMVRDLAAEPRATVDEQAARLLARVRAASEAREGLRSVLEGRKPAWSP